MLASFELCILLVIVLLNKVRKCLILPHFTLANEMCFAFLWFMTVYMTYTGGGCLLWRVGWDGFQWSVPWFLAKVNKKVIYSIIPSVVSDLWLIAFGQQPTTCLLSCFPASLTVVKFSRISLVTLENKFRFSKWSHGDAVVSIIASCNDGSGFKPAGWFGSLCVELAGVSPDARINQF